MKEQELDKLLRTEFKTAVVEPSTDFTSTLLNLVEPAPVTTMVQTSAPSSSWLWAAIAAVILIAGAFTGIGKAPAAKVEWQTFSSYFTTPIGTITLFALFLIAALFVLEDKLMRRAQ